jgi:transposase-like protein
VGIFEEIVTTDTLGRRTGPRARHTIEDKLRIVEETRAQGASVAMVARRHNVIPNQVFAWRQLYRRGLLHPPAAKRDAKMLPVKGKHADCFANRAGSAYSAEQAPIGASAGLATHRD